jgi:hypothetical protein
MRPGRWPVGEGEMARLVRAHDWAATPLGPVEEWPRSLKTAVGMILAAPQPMWIGWGPDYIQLYNDAYAALLGAERHPAILAQPAAEAWASIWHLMGPDLDAILAGGPAVSYADQLVAHRHDGEVRDLYFTHSYSPIPDAAAPNGVGGVLSVGVETTPAVALRASEERQAFLLRLSDALRPLADPAEIQAEATRVLGQHLGAGRALYAEADGEHVVVERDHTDGLPSSAGRHHLDSFGPTLMNEIRAGRTLAVADTAQVASDPRLSEADQTTYAAVGVRAFVGVPLVKEGRFVALFGLHSATPRAWTSDEVALVEETAERTWAAVERARAEKALRESEELVDRNPRVLSPEMVPNPPEQPLLVLRFQAASAAANQRTQAFSHSPPCPSPPRGSRQWYTFGCRASTPFGPYAGVACVGPAAGSSPADPLLSLLSPCGGRRPTERHGVAVRHRRHRCHRFFEDAPTRGGSTRAARPCA